MSEPRPSSIETSSPHDREPRPRFDLSTIMGIKVDEITLPDEITQMADAYLEQLAKDGANQSQLAELAYAFRRQLQEDLRLVRDVSSSEASLQDEGEKNDAQKGSLIKRLRTKHLMTDETHAFSLAVYRKLLESASGTIQTELARHEHERIQINGDYETYQGWMRDLNQTREQYHALLASMFKTAGQEASPFHLAKRAVLETKIADMTANLEMLKEKKPDIAALVAHDTINEYAKQLRGNGFVWTPSRRKLLEDILKASLTNRPVVALIGETGTGKTAIVRAASHLLSSREPERTVGGNQEKFARLLASPAISEGKTYYEYGPILRAMTGKTSSIDDNFSGEGHIFFDDEFNTRPTSVQREMQKFLSEARVSRQVSIPGTSLVETVSPGFLVFLAGNPPSERYDREETGIETKREFAGNVLNVEYLTQTAENPELYQVLMASLMDQKTGRLTVVTPDEVAPAWQEHDATTGESHLDTDPTEGGFLWRFSNAWGELFKAFSHKDTVLHEKNTSKPKAEYYLPTFILDPGVVLTWMDRYKASPKDRRRHIGDFLKDNLAKYLSQFPEAEQKIVEDYLNHFGITLSAPSGTSTKEKHLRVIHATESVKPAARVLTPKEVGYLNPNVPRPIEKRAIPPTDTLSPLINENGETIGQYVKVAVLGIEPDTDLARRSDVEVIDVPESVTFLGVGYDDAQQTININIIHVRANDGTLKQYDQETFMTYFLEARRISETPSHEKGELANLQEARDILGADNVLGTEAVKATWDRDLAPHEIPPVPYSREQLEGAKRMNMMLILRVDKDKDGNALTGAKMNELIQPKLTTTGKGKLLLDTSWYQTESFNKDTTPRLEWKLVTRDLLQNSTNLDYTDQTKLLRDTLVAQPDLTPEEQDAIAQADNATLARLKTAASSTDEAIWKPAAHELANLKINQNHRRSFADTIFDHVSLLQTSGGRLFNGEALYEWTNDLTSFGGLVHAGRAGSDGADVGGWHPGSRGDSLGVSFSR